MSQPATADRILDAAGRLFATNGFAETSLRSIASGEGVAKGLRTHPTLRHSREGGNPSQAKDPQLREDDSQRCNSTFCDNLHRGS